MRVCLLALLVMVASHAAAQTSAAAPECQPGYVSVPLYAPESQQMQHQCIEKSKHDALRNPTPDNPDCGLPKPHANDEIIFFGSYEGDRISNVTLGADGTNTVAKLTIEPGTKPLYLILTTYGPTIWKFEGDVKRVRQAAFTGYMRHKDDVAIGVVGLAKEKLTFLKPSICFPKEGVVEEHSMKRTADALAKQLGRAPDRLIYEYSVTPRSIPSNTAFPGLTNKERFTQLTNPPAGMTASGWDQILQYNPGGIETLEATKVITPWGAAEKSAVMGQAAGLAQLVLDGKLSGPNKYSPDGRDTYTILGPIEQLPGGLSGGHSVNFLLPEGIPEPKGDLGHSKLIRANELERPASHATCILPKPAPEDEVIYVNPQAVGGNSPNSLAGQERDTRSTAILVSKGERPIYLILDSREAMLWLLTEAPERLSRVVVLGPSGHTGKLAAGLARKEQIDAAKVTFTTPDACSVGTYPVDGSVAGMQMRQLLQDALGRPVDKFITPEWSEIVRVPEGKVTRPRLKFTPPNGVSRELWIDYARTNPVFLKLRPDEILSEVTPEPYQLQIGHGGIIRYVVDGQLKETGERNSFTLMREVPRWPAQLTDRYYVKLDKGVQPPPPNSKICLTTRKGKFLSGAPECGGIPANGWDKFVLKLEVWWAKNGF